MFDIGKASLLFPVQDYIVNIHDRDDDRDGIAFAHEDDGQGVERAPFLGPST